MEIKDIDLGRLVVALEKYNHQFNGDAIMARLLMSYRGQGEENEELDFEIERQMAWGKIEGDFGEVIKATGLSLEPVAGAMTLFTGSSKIPASEMRLNVADADAFILYLSLLSRPLTSSQIYGLSGVAKNFTFQLTRQYKLDDLTDERILNLFSCLSRMTARYQELGLGDSVKNLAKYLEISRKGYIREYLIVERLNFFAEVGGQHFGPSKWHTDMSPKHYRERWVQAVNALRMVSRNPRAGEFAKRFQNHLKNCAEYALRDIREGNPRYETKAHHKFFKRVLRKSLVRLMAVC